MLNKTKVKPIQVLLGLESFYSFFLKSNIDVLRNASHIVSQREVFPKAGVT